MLPIITTEILKGGLDKYLGGTKSSYRPKSHHISSVGHPCQRWLYYSIHDWDAKPDTPNGLQAIFDCGKKLETPLLCHFNENVGPRCTPKLTIIEQQKSISDKLMDEYNITGTMDGVLAMDTGERYVTRLGPIDAKTCSANMFRVYQENDLNSLKRFHWSYKYIAQIMLYAFAENFECGYLFFISKQNPYYDWKLIPVPVDYAFIDDIILKVRKVNKALKIEVEPERINQPFWCKACDFEHICIPEIVVSGEGQVMNMDEEAQSLLDRVNELKPYAREHKQTYDLLKKKLVKGRQLIMRDCLIDWTHIEVAEKTVKAYAYDKPKFTPFREDEVDEEE